MPCCVCCEEEKEGRNDVVRTRSSDGHRSTVAPPLTQRIDRDPLKVDVDSVALSSCRSTESHPNKGSVSTNTTSSHERSNSTNRHQISDEESNSNRHPRFDEESHSSEIERVQRALQRPVKEQAAIASLEVHESLLKQSSKTRLDPLEPIELNRSMRKQTSKQKLTSPENSDTDRLLSKQFPKRNVISAEGSEVLRYSKHSARWNMESIEEIEIQRSSPRQSPTKMFESDEAIEIRGPSLKKLKQPPTATRRFSGEAMRHEETQRINKYDRSQPLRKAEEATIDSIEVDDLSEVRALSPIRREENDINSESQIESGRLAPSEVDAKPDTSTHMSENIEVEIDKLDAIVKALEEKERDRVNESGDTEHSSKSAPSRRSRNKSPPKLSPSSRDSPQIKHIPTASPSSSHAQTAKTSPDSEKSLPKTRRKSMSTLRTKSRDSPIPRNSSESHHSLLDQSESDLYGTKSSDSFPSHIRYEESTQPFEVALSDIPSEVDDDARERYLMACRILKATLIEKEQTLLPAEKSFLDGLLRGDDEDPTEAHVAAVETASQALLMDPLFRIDSLSSAQFEINDGESTIDQSDKAEWRNVVKSSLCRAVSPATTRVSEKTAIIHNRSAKPISDDIDDANSRACSIATHSECDDMDSPFKILGVDRVSYIVLTPSLMEALRGFFPYSVAEENFWLKFSLERDGASLITLLSQVRASKHTIICIETRDGHVFGAFCSSHWRKQPAWYGSGESFLWRLKRSRRVQNNNNDNMNEMEIYPFTGHDELVQFCTDKTMAVGGGDWGRLGSGNPYANEPTGIGLMIDSDLMGGETNSCATFENPRLCGRTSKSNEFDVFGLEVWTLTPCGTDAEAERLEMHRLFVEEHSAKS